MKFQLLDAKNLVSDKNIRTLMEADTEGFDELVESIEKHGLIQPILVRPLGKGQYQVIAGHRRFSALQKLGRNEIPCIESASAGPVETLVENVQRTDLDWTEICRGLEAIIASCEKKPKQKELAMMLGKSQPWVSNHVHLIKKKVPATFFGLRNEMSEAEVPNISTKIPSLEEAKAWSALEDAGVRTVQESASKFLLGGSPSAGQKALEHLLKDKKEGTGANGEDKKKGSTKGETSPKEKGAVEGEEEMQLACPACGHVAALSEYSDVTVDSGEDSE